MNESAKDVSQRILDRHIIYGGSDNTNPRYASANKSLNYRGGGSINKPEQDKVSIIPFTLNYNDTVGLFGSENHFVKVTVNIDRDNANLCFEEADWECSVISDADTTTVNSYAPATIDVSADLNTVNTYVPAQLIQNSLVVLSDAFISVDLSNLKTNNKFIDNWFDVRLYNKNRKEHPYDKMFVRMTDYFYIGFHARNTKRLPYNVQCIIGNEYVSGLNEETMRYENI